MLITSNEVFRESVEGLEVEIDQEIFIYDKDEKEVHEIYTINGVKIQRKLGQFRIKCSIKDLERIAFQ